MRRGSRWVLAAGAVLAVTHLGAQTPPAATQDQCGPATRQALTTAAGAMHAGITAEAERVLDAAHQADARCPAVQLARLAVSGWNAARAAAAVGGTLESLQRPRRSLQDLEQLSEQPVHRLENAYSRSLLSAAMAAAQDERDEMRVHLEQAAYLRVRVDPQSGVGLWPLPLNEAEGELWLEVDDVAAALVAFRRAVGVRRSGVALLGLARSAARLDDWVTACRTYQEWRALPRSNEISVRALEEKCQ